MNVLMLCCRPSGPAPEEGGGPQRRLATVQGIWKMVKGRGLCGPRMHHEQIYLCKQTLLKPESLLFLQLKRGQMVNTFMDCGLLKQLYAS